MTYKDKFIFIAGPCVIENRKITLEIARYLTDLTARYPVSFIFKASFDKANRTAVNSFRGPGLAQGIEILAEVKQKLNVPVLSDVHSCEQVKDAAEVLDIIQIPAFLCRQTDLVLAAAQTQKTVNIKKGQFLAPQDVRYIVEKIESVGNRKILITERGSTYGYNDLVVDFRSFLIMKELGYPVIYDATHSLQRPSAAGGISGGDRKFIPGLALAAAACGVNGLFMEVHPRPQEALSDKHTVYPLNEVEELIQKVLRVRDAVREQKNVR